MGKLGISNRWDVHEVKRLTVGLLVSLTVGDVAMPDTRRRCSTWGLVRRRPGRATLIPDRASHGMKTPDSEPSPVAEST
jgi:hypothetical protein